MKMAENSRFYKKSESKTYQNGNFELKSNHDYVMIEEQKLETLKERGYAMLERFGIHRVLEPEGAVPVTSWKMDNRKEIGKEEARISLERIHVEKSSFQQICNQCEYNESKMIQRFFDIIEKRGKLHNPFTETGGMIYGTIEEMGSEFRKEKSYQVGDDFLCLVTMTAIPIHIDEIEEIDFNYGQLKVKGYAIIFPDTFAYKEKITGDLRYTMAALEEAGSLYGIYNAAKNIETTVVIGKDIVSALLYCSVIRKAAGNRKCNLHVIMDYDSYGSVPEDFVREVLLDYADQVHFADVRNAIGSYRQLADKTGPADLVINCEDKTGTETLSIFLCKNNGTVYFTNMSNNYSASILIAESMKKQIYASDLDQYFEGYDSFTAALLKETEESLLKVNRLYKEFAESKGISPRTARVMEHYKASQTDDYIYASPVTEEMVEEVINVAKYDCNVIIQGETGVGKEKVLQLIHKNSSRKEKPCIKVNCATIQENLAESEFFGYEEGSFTGARSGGKKGYFELANNGILFLDEIGTLSLNMQSKLLRVLQENQFYRVGGTKQINVNVRVICANNINLLKLVDEGKFREDLYYRLNICQINVVPLRKRPEDIYVLAREFLGRYNKKYNTDKEISEEGYEALMRYSWPGNVRELENAVHRMVINAKEEIITGIDAERMVHQNAYNDNLMDMKEKYYSGETFNFDAIMDEQEKRLVSYALKTEKTTRKAAASLGITQAKLMRIKKKHNL